MDIKRLVIGMVLAMALMFGWQYIIVKEYARHPEWKKPGQETAQTETSSTKPTTTLATATGPATTQSGALATATAATTQGAAPNALPVRSAPTAATAPLGSATHADPTYALQATTTGRGAGIDSVLLNDFFATVDKKSPYTFESPFTESGTTDASRPLATRSVTVDAQTYDLAAANWTLESKTDSSATYRVDVGPVVVRKTYDVRPRNAPPAGSDGYEITVQQTIQNTGKSPVSVATSILGPVAPPREIDSVDDRQIIAGYQADGSVVAIGERLSTFTAEKPSLDLTRDKKGHNITWFGASSSFFDAILRPLPAPEGHGKTMPLRAVTAQALNPDEKNADLRLVTASLQTAPVSLAPGESATLPMDVFFGPKKRDLLNNAYYSALPLGYDSTLNTNTSACYSYCTFGWLINILVALLAAFHWIVRDWGLAIIILVALVRVCLHPITKRSQISMLKMGKMGPEIDRLKKKHGDNKEELNKAMMQVYKEQGATPILGCLPMVLQMPIWIALYDCLQNTFELRHAGFLWFGNWGLTWIRDLAKPDRLFYFPHHPLNLIFFHVDAINLLPILMALVYWLQQKYTPKPPANTPEQAQQQKMMQWMSLIFPVFLYNYPAGLNLYIVTSTGVGIVESKIIRDHIKQREEAEREGRVIVEPTRKMRRGGGGGNGDGDDRSQGRKSSKSGGIAGLLANLQQKADQMRQQQQKKK